MAIALPLAVNDNLIGTAFIAGTQGNRLAFVTALHHLAAGTNFKVALPPHGGDMAQAQPYPLLQTPAFNLDVILTEPLLDLAILLTPVLDQKQPPAIPRFITEPREIKVGDEVIIAGYPFAPIGSMLETAQVTHVSAIGQRLVIGGGSRLELILSAQTHPGSSGSPVVRRSDGVLCGVIRGCLAPPSTIAIGNLPIGTDTSVTYATSADT
ncbi:MAG TPA: serine protease, partial [Pyrinomonadaceae bacterium]